VYAFNGIDDFGGVRGMDDAIIKYILTVNKKRVMVYGKQSEI